MLVVNTVTNKVSRVLGKDETLRYLNVSLYQGAPAKKGITTLAMAASANPLLQEKAERDPHVFCTAYKKSRFYVFGRSDREEKGDRDVFNERPTREEQTVMVAPEKKKATATSLTIHTTMGDIVCVPPPSETLLTRSTSSCSRKLRRRRSRTSLRTSIMVITTISFFTESSKSSCCKLVILLEMERAVRVAGEDTLKTSSIQITGMTGLILCPWQMLDQERTGRNSSLLPYRHLGSMTNTRTFLLA